MKKKEICRKMLQALLSFVIIGSLIFAVNSCKNTSKQKNDKVSQEDVKREIKEAAETTEAYLNEEQQKIISDLEAQIDKAESEIEKLNQQMESARSDLKEEYQHTINSLETMSNSAQKKAEQLKKSSEDAWDEIKEEVDSSLTDLEQSIEEAKNEFEKNYQNDM